jgi:predicted porin
VLYKRPGIDARQAFFTFGD